MDNLGVVSVIVPIYKVEKQLKRCVDSLRSQTYPFLELILVDDGSPDRCGTICDEYAALDERVKVIHKENAGLGFARNSGLDCATGDFVVFVDSDDHVAENYVETLVKALHQNDADLASMGFIREYETGAQQANPTTERQKVFRGAQVAEEILLPIIGAPPEHGADVEREMSVWLNIYKRDIIERAGLRFFSEREVVSEDILFNTAYIFLVRSAVLLPDCLYYYAENSGSLTKTYRADRFKKYCKMLQIQKEMLDEQGILEKARLRLYRMFIMKTKKCIALLAGSECSWKEKKRECDKLLHSELLVEILKEYKQYVQNGSQKVQLFLLEHKLSCGLLLYYQLKAGRKVK